MIKLSQLLFGIRNVYSIHPEIISSNAVRLPAGAWVEKGFAVRLLFPKQTAASLSIFNALPLPLRVGGFFISRRSGRVAVVEYPRGN
jgi:hypothetical protein